MKVIQINAWHFKYLNELKEFLIKEQPDIVNFQEVCSGRFNYCDPNIKHPFDYIKNELKMDGLFAPFICLKGDNNDISHSGNAFLTSLEIVDTGIFFEKSLPGYTVFTEENDLMKTIFLNDKSKYYNVFEEPKNYVWAVLKTKDGRYIRNLTTHYTVSYKATETLQMIRQTRSVLEFLESTRDMPTIFSGDLNIHDQSASIAKLKEKLELINVDTTNSLNREIHPIFKDPDIDGLRVDYIFQKGFKVLDYSVPDITVSDHLPVIAELELVI